MKRAYLGVLLLCLCTGRLVFSQPDIPFEQPAQRIYDSNSRYVVVCPILSFCESLKPNELWCSESQDGHE